MREPRPTALDHRNETTSCSQLIPCSHHISVAGRADTIYWEVHVYLEHVQLFSSKIQGEIHYKKLNLNLGLVFQQSIHQTILQGSACPWGKIFYRRLLYRKGSLAKTEIGVTGIQALYIDLPYIFGIPMKKDSWRPYCMERLFPKLLIDRA